MRMTTLCQGLLLALFAGLSACGATGSDISGGLLGPGNGGTGTLQLEATGPDDEPTGVLEVEAGSLTEGFVATLLDAAGQPIANRFIAFSVNRGFVNAPPSRANSSSAATDSLGRVRFSYQAPDSVTSRASVLIELSVASTATSPGVETDYELFLIPAQPPVVTLTCPPNAAPGIENNGYSVLVERANGEQVPEACVSLTVSGATISPSAQTTCTAGNGNETNDLGRFDFSLTPAASNNTSDVALTIRAATTVAGRAVTESCQTTVRADTFQFTDPEPGAPIVVGSSTRERLRFQWTRSPQTAGGAQGVAGQLTLEATVPGQLVVDGATSGAQRITVNTGAGNNGDFTQAIFVTGNRGGSSTITAEDSTGREATLIVQFVDTPSQANLDATPLIVETSPNEGRYSQLTVTVLNQTGAPIQGVDVDFNLTQSASSNANERVFPARQQTDASGQAKSRYEAGPTAGIARVQAVIEGGLVTNTREITVAAPTP